MVTFSDTLLYPNQKAKFFLRTGVATTLSMFFQLSLPQKCDKLCLFIYVEVESSLG